jgi:predicted transcriptional regulator
MSDHPHPTSLLEWTTRIAAAHVSRNAMQVADIGELLNSVYRSLEGLASGKPKEAEPMPAVPVRRSVAPDHIVCLEDGKKLKMLKRHLKTNYGMTPEEYRKKWGLPADYPMVAPNYAAHRSQIAKKIGLGRQGTAARMRG